MENKTVLKLVVDNTKNKLETYLDNKNSDVKPEKSKSLFVNQMTSFCDELDRQIEELMNM